MSTTKISQLPAATSANPGAVIPATNAAGTTTEKVTVAQIVAQAPVQSVAGKTGTVTLAKGDVGLSSVDNTSDAAKPVSTATQTALNGKVDTTDGRLTDAREWSAATVTQVDAEAGVATDRRAWTVQRVWQAIAAWWATVTVGTSKIADGAITAAKIAANQDLIARSITTGVGVFQENASGSISLENRNLYIYDSSSTVLFRVNPSGVVVNGSWQATPVGVSFGGTGATDAATARANLGALPANAPILPLGTLTSSTAINYGTDRLIQTLTLNGTAVSLTKGTGWPTDSSSADVVLRITISATTTVTFAVVTDWFSQPTAPMVAGTHLILLRAIGAGIMEGHYIGAKTN